MTLASCAGSNVFAARLHEPTPEQLKQNMAQLRQPERTVRVLQQYRRSGNEIERPDAREILIEFDMDNTKNAVRDYFRGK